MPTLVSHTSTAGSDGEGYWCSGHDSPLCGGCISFVCTCSLYDEISHNRLETDCKTKAAHTKKCVFSN